MYELLLRGERALDDHVRAARWVDVVVELLGAPVRYDWNSQQQWKPFDRDRLSIDLVGQGCHVVRVEDGEGGLAVIDTGRRSGLPALMIATAATPPEPATLRDWYESLQARVGVLWHPPSRVRAGERLFGQGAWERGDDGAGPPPESRRVAGAPEWSARWSEVVWSSASPQGALGAR